MVRYNLDWLKEKGFFEKTVPLPLAGKDVSVDEKNSLAYAEVKNNEEIEEIKRGLSSHKVRYIWFYFPSESKLKTFRKIGEVKWFFYSPRMRGEYLKSRIDKLNRFSPTDMNILFDIRDVVNRFYWQLWEARIKMARSVKKIEGEKNKLLAVQHLIDRLIFFYFLAQLGLVSISSGNGKRIWKLDRTHTRQFFDWICGFLDDEKLQEFLNRVFFDVLGKVKEDGWSGLGFNIGGERFSVVAPSLNGGLFREEKIGGIEERAIKIAGTKELILDILNKYNWIIGEESPEEEDVIGDLTPEIIGHIYEKFVVSLEQIGLEKIDFDDIQTVKGELKQGRKKIGAYYTPEEITNYISMNTIYPYITDRINERFKRRYRNIWKELLNKEKLTKERLTEEEAEIVKFLYFEVLTKLRICDNACGSGSFLIAAGKVLLPLYSRVIKLLKDYQGEDEEVKEVLEDIKRSPSRNYYIVRQIITNNLYGVDIMEGAVEFKTLSVRDAERLKEKLDKEIRKAREFLHRRFFEMAEAKGVEMPYEDYEEFAEDLKPFHWGFEFYDAFDLDKPKEERGFDVVIGNPPYGNILKGVGKKWIKKTYPFKTTVTDQNGKGSLNAASVFIERSNSLLKKDSRFGYIVPNSISRTEEFLKLRKFLMEDTYLHNIVDEGSPFVGVTLEMISIFYKNRKLEKDYKINIFSRRKNVDKVNNLVNKSIFHKYSRFIFYWDYIWETVAKDGLFNFLDGKRGITISSDLLSNTKDESHKIPVLVSGKCVGRYHLLPEKFNWGNDLILTSNEAKKTYDRDMLISVRLSSEYRIAIKPKEFVAADNVIRLIFDENMVDKRYMALILNSNLMRYVTWKYLSNCINLTMFINAITSSTPIKICKSQTTFVHLCNYMLFLNEIEERRKTEKELIEFIDKQVIDALVYELYFKEKFEEEGLKTNLLALVEPYLKDIEGLEKEEGKLRVIKEVVERIKSDGAIKEQMEELKSHSWVKIIEENERN